MDKEKAITDKIIGGLMDHIREKRLKEGDFLETEKELLKKFDVSRNILREALGYLKGMGLLTSRRGSGFKVAKPDVSGYFGKYIQMMFAVAPDSFQEIYNLRKIMELGCVGQAVRNATDEQVEGIKSVADKLGMLDESSPGAFHKKLQLEAEFHTRITEPAKCGMLDAINSAIKEYFSLMERVVSETDGKKNIMSDVAEHRMIALAFEARQPETALLCLSRHLNKK